MYFHCKYVYRFWDPENRKIRRHKNVIFIKKKMYKDLLTKSTSKKDLKVAPRRTFEQQEVADPEFILLDDAHMEKARNIPKGNMGSPVTPSIPPK